MVLMQDTSLVADAPKEDAKKAVDSLKELGVKNIVMLSGDKQAIVSKLASELNITQAFGDLLPEGKVRTCRKAQNRSNQ